MKKKSLFTFIQVGLSENQLRSINGGAEVTTCPDGYDHDTVTNDGCTEYWIYDWNGGEWKKDHEVCDTSKCN